MAIEPDAALLSQWTSSATTRRGEVLRIRPLCPADRQREIDFINSLSEQSRYLRLLTPLRFLSPHLLDQLMDIDYQQRMAPARSLGFSVTFVPSERLMHIDRELNESPRPGS